MKGSRKKAFSIPMVALILAMAMLLPQLGDCDTAMAADSIWTEVGGLMGYKDCSSMEWSGSGLYVAFKDGSVWHYDTGTSAWTDTNSGSDQYVSDFSWTGAGLYAAFYGRGIWRYDPAADVWSDISRPLISTYANCLAWDGSHLYAGTQNQGVWRYDPASGTWTDTGGGLSAKQIRAICWGGSGLYAGTYDGGVYYYDPGTSSWSNTGGAVGAYIINSLAWDGSSLYAGTWAQGVWCYNPVAATWTNTGGGVSLFVMDGLCWNGSILYATASLDHGVWGYDPVTGKWTNTGLYLNKRDVHCLAWGGDALYAGTWGDGFWRYGPPVWYLAEGCTDGGMETWVLVQNPNGDPVDVALDFMTSEGLVEGPRRTIPGDSRRSYNVGEYVTTYDVSTKVTASDFVICERAMYGNNRTWGHDSIGVTSPSDTWYLAEGCTAGGFETWILVQNPGGNPVDINMVFQTDSGEVQGPKRTIAANSRSSYNVGEFVSSYNVSTLVTTDGGGVVCERAMYGNNRIWAHESIGVTAPDAVWSMAEGCTAGGFETWILVQNPGDTSVDIDMYFMTASDVVPGPLETIPPRSRRSYNAGEFVQDYDVSTIVFAEGGEIICERAMYGNNRTWGHDSIGVPYSANVWCLAEGCTDGGFETWILVANMYDQPTSMEMYFMTDSGLVEGPAEEIPPFSRRSYNVSEYVVTYDVSTLVLADEPNIICERAMYGNNRTWGHDSIGYSPAVTTSASAAGLVQAAGIRDER